MWIMICQSLSGGEVMTQGTFTPPSQCSIEGAPGIKYCIYRNAVKKIKIAFSTLFLYKRERRKRIAFIDQHIPIMMFYLNNHKWAICSNLFLYSQHEIIPHPLKFFYESKMG